MYNVLNDFEFKRNYTKTNENFEHYLGLNDCSC